MSSAAGKEENLLHLAAVCLVAVLIAAPAAGASRTLPRALTPDLEAPAPSLDALQIGAASLRLGYWLFGDLRLPERPLELVEARRTATGVKHLDLELNIWQTGGLAQECGGPSFQGLWTDPVTGISYARNRWLDTRNAVWMSEDPKGRVDSANLYAFVGWGPHMAVDPMGDRLREESLYDPKTPFYEYNGKQYQLAKSGLVFNIGWFETHKAETNAETVAAIRDIAGYEYGGDNKGLQGLAREVRERVTEEDIEMIALLYWSAAGAPFAGGGQTIRYATMAIGATSGFLQGEISGVTPLEQTRMVVGSAYGSLLGGRVAQIMGGGLPSTLFVAGSSGNIISQLSTGPPSDLNVVEVVGAGIVSAHALALAGSSPIWIGVFASGEVALWEVFFSAASEAEKAPTYEVRYWDHERGDWVTEQILKPPEEERLDISDFTLGHMMGEDNDAKE